jgi:hypothetical protein
LDFRFWITTATTSTKAITESPSHFRFWILFSIVRGKRFDPEYFPDYSFPYDPVFLSHRGRIADLAAKSRLPTVFNVGQYTEAGGLIAYGPSLTDMFRRSAIYIDKILKGAKPADLPVEQPTKFELIINLKAAEQIGLTIPPNVLVRADNVIK